jgi:hypothetical protein
MRVLKVIKHLRASDDIFYRIIWNDDVVLESESFEDDVRGYCDERGGGECYGYSCDYDFETDPEVIKKVINDEINKSKARMQYIQEDLDKLYEIKNTL